MRTWTERHPRATILAAGAFALACAGSQVWFWYAIGHPGGALAAGITLGVVFAGLSVLTVLEFRRQEDSSA
jgi:hypothetical protein